ncbi:hypothetical protein M3201_18545 [Paenibacillus motobuensis]|uniref:hypothetical protein n=1 Tax=Paenibacillus TaxID=44249 RepID=UPI00203D4755|nr:MULTISPECIES: hypothetical protein [Paenibacillus]MCM3041697.1 hypothetical protein [Paenibacillus lutimineralis]MCM3648801.1 hypothetical protein [Paenibacillus motobuensis]
MQRGEEKMTQYALEHPYISAVLIVFTLLVIEHIFSKMAVVMMSKNNRKGGTEDGKTRDC